ncbi:LemA family protein [Dinghuibacter silviterrae]|uniref:LemA protein n=1 Tax=Dinghuibacter silviterrae TaxID=1539049 RepID=A0A4R8DM20_9BACT|nr:LemA family protein [Dinghuibacter silviterrae]TDW99001.1 LemA protein [Dinghuibacter silviterrae]
MKHLGLYITLGILLILFMVGCNGYNGLATQDQDVKQKWSVVEAQYQRKKNLYENVVATIKGSARNEDTTLIKITQMRSRIPTIDPNNPQTLNEANRAYDQMKSSILNINFENYPNIQTTQAFRDFQAQIEGTENRVTTAIRDWSGSVQDFNTRVVRFPGSIIASLFGFKQKPYFQADEGAKDTKVDFGS